AFSHSAGRLMNAWGVSNTTGRDEYTGPSAMPTRPMSWYSGSQLTAESSDVVARPAGPLMASMFAHRLRCDSATPFGAAVDPEVNWTNATSSNFVRSWVSTAGGSRSSLVNTTLESGRRARVPRNPP